MSLLGEIKRRKVFQVAAVYVVVAWLLIQVVDVVNEPLNLPDWFDTAVIVALGIGFPIAVILAWAFDLTPQGIKADSAIRGSSAPAQSGGHRINYLLQGLVLVAVGFLVVDQYLREPRENSITASSATTGDSSAELATSAAASPSMLRFSFDLGATLRITNSGLNVELAISPDGRQIIYSARSEGTSQLYLRPLDRLEPEQIPGTQGGRLPFFSHDGEWIGFYDELDIGLKHLSVRGGEQRTTLAARVGERGAAWSSDDTYIIYAVEPGTATVPGLYRIPRTGGTPDPLVTPAPGTAHEWPEVLPGDNAILFTVRPSDETLITEGSIAILSLETGEYRTIIEEGYAGRYAPTGHLVFMRVNTLWAVPFDIGRLETTGPEAPVINGLGVHLEWGGVPYAFSDNGTLVYSPGGNLSESEQRTLVWVDREGNEESLITEPRSYLHPRLSPNGQRLAVTVAERGNRDVYVYDLARATSNRVTFSAGYNERPIWTPDGERLVYGSEREETGLFMKAADGTGQEIRLTTDTIGPNPDAFSPDGSHLVYWASQPSDLFLLSMDGDPVSEPLLAEDFDEDFSAISPDGKWIAYESNEEEVQQVYVQPFPNVEDGKWLISRESGAIPVWGPNGRELFYWNTIGGAMMMVAVESEPTFSAGNPEELFDTGTYFFDKPGFDVSPDGRFLLMKSVGDTERLAEEISAVVVYNWFEELNRLAPPAE